jgi:hypothetical protein
MTGSFPNRHTTRFLDFAAADAQIRSNLLSKARIAAEKSSSRVFACGRSTIFLYS